MGEGQSVGRHERMQRAGQEAPDVIQVRLDGGPWATEKWADLRSSVE